MLRRRAKVRPSTARPARPGPRGSIPRRRPSVLAPGQMWLRKRKAQLRSAMEPSQRESGVAVASESPCPESSLARTVTKLRSPWPTNRPPESGEIRDIPPPLAAEPPAYPRNRNKWLTILLHALLIGAVLWCAAFVETPQAPYGRSSHGPLIVGVDPGRAQRK